MKTITYVDKLTTPQKLKAMWSNRKLLKLCRAYNTVAVHLAKSNEQDLFEQIVARGNLKWAQLFDGANGNPCPMPTVPKQTDWRVKAASAEVAHNLEVERRQQLEAELWLLKKTCKQLKQLKTQKALPKHI